MKTELLNVLKLAIDSKEYFNPNMIDAVINGIIDVYGDDSVSDEIRSWASNMWSR